MTMFSAGFFQFLILFGLLWTGLGALTLILLFVRDWKKGELW